MRFLRFLPWRRRTIVERTTEAQSAPGGAMWAQGMLARCHKRGGWFNQRGNRLPGPIEGEVRAVVAMMVGPEVEGTTVYLQFSCYRGAFSAAYFTRDALSDLAAPGPIPPADLPTHSKLHKEGAQCLS